MFHCWLSRVEPRSRWPNPCACVSTINRDGEPESVTSPLGLSGVLEQTSGALLLSS